MKPTSKGIASTAAWLAVVLSMGAACAKSASYTPTPVPSPPAVATQSAPAPAAADTTTPVTLRTDSTRYKAGGGVGLTLVNGSDAQYAFNACTRVIEQSAGSGWQPVSEPGRACTMQAVLLQPHGTQTASTELPSSLGVGRYRVVIELSREGATPAQKVRAESAPFEVAP